jgi:hypothetical protein
MDYKISGGPLSLTFVTFDTDGMDSISIKSYILIPQ